MLGSKIMIIEDDSELALDLKERLESFHYSLLSIVDDREKAFAEIVSSKPDLILLDMHLGGQMAGIVTAYHIRDVYSIPIILLSSGFGNDPNNSRPLKLGAFPILQQPLVDCELATNIERNLCNSQHEPTQRDHEAYYRAMIDNPSELLLVIDGNGTIQFHNQSANTILGDTGIGFVGVSWLDLIYPGDLDAMMAELEQESRSNDRQAPDRFRVRHRDGSWRMMELQGSARIKNLQYDGYILSLRDITEQVKTETFVQLEKTQARKIIDSARVFLLSLDADGNIRMVNEHGCKLLGYEEAELLGKNWFATCLPQASRTIAENTYQMILNEESHLHKNFDFEVVTKNRQTLCVSWQSSILSVEDDRITEVLLCGEDITERRREEERLRFNAEHDHLTGLPNRMAFIERLEASIYQTNDDFGHRFAVLYLDLDSFKLINDSFGHDFGDRFLVATARRLERCLRTDDLVARLSGDEFFILMDKITSPNDTIAVAEKILKELANPIMIEGQSISTSCSIGIVICSNRTQHVDEILRDADIAMYQAKNRGKAGYSFFMLDMRTQPIARLKLENELRMALDRNEFSLMYQPIVKVSDGCCIGFEALLRWNHPKDGIMPTDLYIPVLEETGLIIPVGEWVLNQACQQIKELQSNARYKKPLSVSVNISVRQLTHPLFIQQVTRAINRSRIKPENLILELTESIFLMDTEMARSILLRLHDLGIRTHIDDFGTGYSSMRYLQSIPFDAIKIDRSFINHLSTETHQHEIVRSIIAMATAIGSKTVAEGVETAEQFDFLGSNGCTYAQGFYISKPLTPSMMKEWIVERSCKFSFNFLPGGVVA